LKRPKRNIYQNAVHFYSLHFANAEFSGGRGFPKRFITDAPRPFAATNGYFFKPKRIRCISNLYFVETATFCDSLFHNHICVSKTNNSLKYHTILA